MKLTKAELQDVLNEYNKLINDFAGLDLDHYIRTTDLICEHFGYHYKAGCKKCPLRKECLYLALNNITNRLAKRIKRMRGE